MTGKTTEDIRYFRSFSAYRHPVQPQEQIEYSRTQELSTYYEARYAQKCRLVEFTKKLRVGDSKVLEWTTVFTELYQYYAGGGLQRRTLRIPGQSDQTWDFDDKQIPWSDYFERIVCRWFGGQVTSERPSPPQLSLLVHEQFTEAEMKLFEAGVNATRDNEWAYETTLQLLEITRELIEQIFPKAAARICAIALAKEQSNRTLWKGFDEPEPNLFGVIESWQDEHRDVSQVETVTLIAGEDLDVMSRQWAVDSKIGSITFAPIRAVSNGKLAKIAMLVLTTERSLAVDELCVVGSIFRRLLLQVQSIIEMARVYQTSKLDSQWP